MEKNWPSRVALFCKCVFLSPAKISVFIHFHLQSIEPAWGEYRCTLISERTLRSYQKRKTRRFLWELGSISRNQWVVCYSENVGVDNCRFDLTLQHLHCLCWWHTTWEPPLLVFVTNESAQVGAVCQSQVPTKVRQTERLHVHACVQFISVQSLSRVRLFVTPWIAADQASLSITNSRSSLRLTSIESVMPSSHLILCHPLLLPPPIPPSITVFSN